MSAGKDDEGGAEGGGAEDDEGGSEDEGEEDVPCRRGSSRALPSPTQIHRCAHHAQATKNGRIS